MSEITNHANNFMRGVYEMAVNILWRAVNAAYYFSPFGNADNDNKNMINGSLGKPWIVLGNHGIMQGELLKHRRLQSTRKQSLGMPLQLSTRKFWHV